MPPPYFINPSSDDGDAPLAGTTNDLFSAIFMKSGANIGFEPGVGTYFDLGKSDPLDSNAFLRVTKGGNLRLIKQDLTTAVSFDTSLLTDARTQTFPDADGTFALLETLPVEIGVAVSDETTALTTGAAKVTIRAPYAFTVTSVRANVNTASSSGIPTINIKESGTTILSTKLTIDAGEKTSLTAAVPAVISDAAIANDAEITFDIDAAGTDTAGLKVWILGHK